MAANSQIAKDGAAAERDNPGRTVSRRSHERPRSVAPDSWLQVPGYPVSRTSLTPFALSRSPSIWLGTNHERHGLSEGYEGAEVRHRPEEPGAGIFAMARTGHAAAFAASGRSENAVLGGPADGRGCVSGNRVSAEFRDVPLNGVLAQIESLAIFALLCPARSGGHAALPVGQSDRRRAAGCLLLGAGPSVNPAAHSARAGIGPQRRKTEIGAALKATFQQPPHARLISSTAARASSTPQSRRDMPRAGGNSR